MPSYFLSLFRSSGITVFVLTLIFSLLFSECEQNSKPVLNEGYIEYDISYPPVSSQDRLLASMMPSKMVLLFKNNLTKSDISVGLGIMNASFISDPINKRLLTLLQIVDKKYALSLDSSQVLQQLHQKPKWRLENTRETKKILGYKCHKVIATGEHGEIINLFYTDDLNIFDSNWSTPYHEIKGVLMEYDLVLNNVRMKLVASKVEGTEISPDVFGVPAGYSLVTKEEMPEIFSQFFD